VALAEAFAGSYPAARGDSAKAYVVRPSAGVATGRPHAIECHAVDGRRDRGNDAKRGVIPGQKSEEGEVRS